MKKNSAFHRVLMRLCFCYATFVFVSSSHLYQNKLFHSFYAFVTDYDMFGDEIPFMISLA